MTPETPAGPKYRNYYGKNYDDTRYHCFLSTAQQDNQGSECSKPYDAVLPQLV
jgi:hypothetical protein